MPPSLYGRSTGLLDKLAVQPDAIDHIPHLGGWETAGTRPIVEERTVKSRQRVKAYGEVFTPRHLVDRMLDLVGPELETGPDFVDKTFLEPAAGDGNFLVAILRRKLNAIEKRYPVETWPQESPSPWPRSTV
ncbi:hypothetical protein GKZ92_23200 (plasmid) [Gordonia sp. 135]|uniref:hypothetical protein n=1 Tax=Gordonia sp. 135 TaxID=2676309 RepID=UPI0012BB2007|nr:hypothetical protein [Gordonia sp. 135]QGP90619.1 hypothetical protein GKZ92_23200 [Gordonia sp. 135]